jgi:hypothetical protein
MPESVEVGISGPANRFRTCVLLVDRPKRTERLGLTRGAIPNRDSMAGLEKPLDHRFSHSAQADPSGCRHHDRAPRGRRRVN